MNNEQVLVEAPPTEIQVFNEVKANIVDFEKMIPEMKFDFTTEKGIDDCEAVKLLVRKVEIRIEKIRKVKGADLLKATKDLNASAKVWHNRVHKMYEVLDAPLQVIRQAKLDAEIDKHDKEQAELKAAEEKREADLQAREAKMAEAETKQKEKDDAAQAVLEAAEREKELEAVKLQAAEEAKLQAAQDAIDAVAKAKQDTADAVAEVQRVAKAEAQAIAERASQDAENALQAKIAEEQAETKRQANVEHQKEFNNLALDAIVAVTGDPASSLRLVKAIVTGKIPNVTMNY